ncbi:metalloproteinase inhibitor 2 [Leptopilina heterotoma]|uniref:metalloproteinase inhibitor 2 n=1 Tax=Leptopilina heterotoma TaxID=63436 RepID=UPI001CA85423|nr:metalloproteinase inhibitor 2 [Leptopilina heterotoma]XP_043477575.1 metalloproteinase inhibitor 2 [Leptopilina heterotoma]XP_043477576.1 metalloproteinase inhibitor 2 [Leptopilina heterotoma]
MRWLLICIHILLVALLLLSVKEAEACSCVPAHLQTKYCLSDFVAVIKVKEVKRGNDTSPTLYMVKVKRVFKNSQGTNLVLEDEIYTPVSSAACGVYLELNKNYVVGGRWEFGRPFISLCGLVMPWETTTKRQRKGLRQLYKMGCQCQIAYTSFNRKGSVLEKSNGKKCLWESEPGPLICQEQHGVCLKGLDGCSWFPSASYKTCIKEHKLNREQRRS